MKHDAARFQALETAHNQLLHSLAHDMRAPVRHVTSYVPLIREALQTDPPQVSEALDWLATLAQSAQQMGRMLEGLQALAHASNTPLHLQPIALNTAMDAARADIPWLASLAQKATTDSAVIQWQIAPDLPKVWADHKLLHQLLVQLLDNACKFTRHQAQPIIQIHTAPSPMAGRAHISIRDNGVGFDNTRAHNLFGIFQRMHSATEFEGVGIGLALCQTIARRHDADICLETALGKGCTVWMDWPLSPA